MMGAILGDPYTIGGNGGHPPSEPLESVFSPSPQQRGFGSVVGLTTNTKVQAHRGLMMPENRGFTDLRWVAPQGGPRWPPSLLGVGVVL